MRRPSRIRSRWREILALVAAIPVLLIALYFLAMMVTGAWARMGAGDHEPGYPMPVATELRP